MPFTFFINFDVGDIIPTNILAILNITATLINFMQNAIAVAGNANIINAKYIPKHKNILLNPLYVSFSFVLK